MTYRPPITMATQHPDNALCPWWKDDPFVSTQDELDELVLLFKELDIDEYMWDWEGKYVDESVGEKLFSKEHEFIKQYPLGEDHHLTYRVTSYQEGKMYRMARAFMNVLAMGDTAQEVGIQRPPVTEMFLPMVSTASEIQIVYEKFREVAAHYQSIFHEGSSHDWLDHYRVTPLVEDVHSMFTIEQILEPYWKMLQGYKTRSCEDGQRLFLARSDPALNAGLIPAVLAVKVVLSASNQLGKKMGFPVYPVLGTGSLPFRGSVNPLYTDAFLEQYAGTRTFSIQSAFRYDYDKDDVQKALKTMKSTIPTLEPMHVSDEDRIALYDLCKDFAEIWKDSIEKLAPTINHIATFVPSRRERVLHIGLFGYSRGVGEVTLPRAIKFTCSFYSLGIPPELVATGRCLAHAKKKGLLDLVLRYYPALQDDLFHAGKYFNKENLDLLAKKESVFVDIQQDIADIESVLGIELGPEKPRHIVHRNITSNIYHRLFTEEISNKDEIQKDIVEAGVIRRSLG